MGAVMSFFECKQADQTIQIDQTEQVDQTDQSNMSLDGEVSPPLDGDAQQVTDDELLALDDVNQEQPEQPEQPEQQEQPDDDEFRRIFNDSTTVDEIETIKKMYKLTDDQIQQLNSRLSELQPPPPPPIEGGRYQRKRNSKKRAKSGQIKKSNRRRRN
jgi:hypothetical protein